MDNIIRIIPENKSICWTCKSQLEDIQFKAQHQGIPDDLEYAIYVEGYCMQCGCLRTFWMENIEYKNGEIRIGKRELLIEELTALRHLSDAGDKLKKICVNMHLEDLEKVIADINTNYMVFTNSINE